MYLPMFGRRSFASSWSLSRPISFSVRPCRKLWCSSLKMSSRSFHDNLSTGSSSWSCHSTNPSPKSYLLKSLNYMFSSCPPLLAVLLEGWRVIPRKCTYHLSTLEVLLVPFWANPVWFGWLKKSLRQHLTKTYFIFTHMRQTSLHFHPILQDILAFWCIGIHSGAAYHDIQITYKHNIRLDQHSQQHIIF